MKRILKRLAYADLAKKRFLPGGICFYRFRCDFSVKYASLRLTAVVYK